MPTGTCNWIQRYYKGICFEILNQNRGRLSFQCCMFLILPKLWCRGYSSVGNLCNVFDKSEHLPCHFLLESKRNQMAYDRVERKSETNCWRMRLFWRIFHSIFFRYLHQFEKPTVLTQLMSYLTSLVFWSYATVRSQMTNGQDRFNPH